MNLPVWWELKLVGGSFSLVEDFKRANSFVVEFLLWLREMEIGGVEPNPISNLVLTCCLPFLVVLCFHPPCCFFQCITSFFVDLRHIFCKFHCSGVCERRGSDGVRENSGIPTIEYHEWTSVSHAVDSVVMSKLSEW